MKDKWIVAAIILLVSMIVADCTTMKTKQYDGVVRGHIYKPSSHWTSRNTDGTYSEHSSSEEHKLSIFFNKDYHSISVDSEQYAIPEGEAVVVTAYKGGFSHITYFHKVRLK